ncbi:ABC transporter permease subunit [Nocardioides convexus]|uniref:ABC transporter permease subunit n=1 Tax=Nocardioides convexus TaxID=2712224 RepID=UPI0024182876|nr:ABC transporter permease subunit [Nocardioides convexus]
MRQVFSQTPPGEREAALALGATRWGVITSVVLPFGRGGIIGGTMLGLGRALGETIAVALIISPAFEIKWHVLEVGAISVRLAHRDPVQRGQPLAGSRPCWPPASCSSC